MKFLFLLSFLLLTTSYSFGQASAAKMNECDFFNHLDSLSENSYSNNKYKNVRENFSLRSGLLKKLESYLIVFGGDSIAPMYLEDSTHRFSCLKYVNEYERAYEKRKNKQSARNDVQRSKYIRITDMLIDLCDLDKPNNDSVERYVAEFEYPFTLEYLYNHTKEAYFESNYSNSLYKLPQLVKEQNLQVLARRMDILDSRTYTYYENYNSKPEFLKGFEMYHDNDVFVPGNQDRELTGGFKFTIITDYLKWRWLRVGNKKEDNILTYQSISLLGYGYTPYIRYRNNFALADSLHKYDRPFASYLCIERAKYRTWKTGMVRHRGEFQAGAMGISQGRKIQAKLHEDFITTSQFVHGWDNQIANGGRLVLQLNHKFDFLLYSNTNRYQTVIKPGHFKVDDPKRKRGCIKGRICKALCKHGDACYKYAGINIIGEADGRIGTIMTTIGGGIRLSTLDFLKQSGNHMIKSRSNSKDGFGWKFDIGINYRYVVHNSLLEGMGWLKPFDEDPYGKVSLDKHVLSENEIERNLVILDYGLSIKSRKTTVFFRQSFHNLEYRSRLSGLDFHKASLTPLIDPKDIEYYNDVVIKEQQSFLNFQAFGKQVYGFGTLGISWIIE